MRLIWFGAVALLSGTASLASLVMPEERRCAIGGERFTALVMVSMNSSGNRPDGRPYATSPPPPLVECPGNGFVYFKSEYSDADKARLAPLVLGADYQAMRKVETRGYRGWWLAKAIEPDPYRRIGLLLGATWESDGNALRKARYQRLFVEAARALPYSDEKRSEWTYYHVRAANALRELGEFRQAARLLRDIVKTDRKLAGDGTAIEMRGLQALIAERNATSEPANLIPVDEIAPRCVDGAGLSPSEVKACATPEAQKQIAFFKANR